MQALICRRYGPFSDLELDEVEAPALLPGGVRIAVSLASLSYAINLMVAGRYQQKKPPPFIPGKEVAGVVVEVAPDVTGVAPGDRVAAIVDAGGFAEQVIAHHSKVFALPAGLSLTSGLALPITYGSSYAALHWRAGLRADDVVLVHGAAGGIGLAAVQIARAAGARVIATAGTEAKRTFLDTQGAALVLPSDDFREGVRQFTGGRGASLVFDPVGGDVFDQSLRCVAPEARVLVMGFASERVPAIPANILLVKDVCVMGFFFGRYTGAGAVDESAIHAPRIAAMMTTLCQLALTGRIAPVVSRVFELARYREAMQALMSRELVGKVALRIGAEP